MREATLGGVSALDARPSRGAAKARPSGASRTSKTPSPRLRRVRAHLALIVGSAGFSAIMIGIILNATVMQKEHHPAPLFGGAAPPVHLAVAPAAPSDTGLVPPLSRPAAPVAAAAPVLPVAAAPLQPLAKAASRNPPAPVALHAPKPADGIARFLAGGNASSRAVAAVHRPARSVSTQPKAAAAAKLRPAVPVAARTVPAPAAAVN